MKIMLEIFNQIPTDGDLMPWTIGSLVAGFAGALAYIRGQHAKQIEALEKIIEYERSEKQKALEKYMSLVEEFTSIFQDQSLFNNK